MSLSSREENTDIEARLRNAQARLEAALTAGGIATWTWDLATDRVVADPNLARLFSVSPEDAAGGKVTMYLQAIHPDDRTRIAEGIADALAHSEGYQAEYRVVLPDGSHRWLTTRGKVERNAAGQAVSLPGVVEDITERVERRQREQFLADLVERIRSLSDPDAVIADAVFSLGKFLGVSRCIFADIDIEADTCTIRPDYRADPAAMPSIAGVVPISAFGAFVVAEYAARRAVAVDDVRTDPIKAPPESIAAYEAIGIRAHVTVPVVHFDRIVSCISVHNTTPRRWKPEEIELLRAVVERTWLTVEVLRQNQALAREAEERRVAHERTAAILESITDAFMAFDSEWRFTYVNDQSERVMARPRSELLGRVFWDEFPAAVGSAFEHEYRRAIDEQTSVTFEEFYPPLSLWVEGRAYPSAGGLSVFYQDVTARKSAEQERERLLAAERTRAEREALLNRVGQALRGSSDPEKVLEIAVREIAQALGADRCYYAAYDQQADTATVGPDWYRPGLLTLAGQYPMSRFTVNNDPVYRAGRTQVLRDSSGDSAALHLGLCALVRVPLVSGASMTALSVAMADGPRDWTPDDVLLVESVATQTQTALEAVRVQRREHRIAQHLQDALQPALPEHVPSLSVGKFTRPALDEAQIGGDFYDLFPLDKGLYALVIGDVSGKGLSAAQQLALIRNSLRTTLYLYRRPAQAAAALNAIITAHDLLVGFVTAFVAVYDTGMGRVVYCSCGHEPGLVCRVGGAVEVLETTETPLGVSENAVYTENAVTLASGDALLLYTDGISEAGPSRREMLGTEGLMRLFQALPGGLTAQAEAEALVAEVGAYTGGVFRDDVAVLLARRL